MEREQTIYKRPVVDHNDTIEMAQKLFLNSINTSEFKRNTFDISRCKGLCEQASYNSRESHNQYSNTPYMIGAYEKDGTILGACVYTITPLWYTKNDHYGINEIATMCLDSFIGGTRVLCEYFKDLVDDPNNRIIVASMSIVTDENNRVLINGCNKMGFREFNNVYYYMESGE